MGRISEMLQNRVLIIGGGSAGVGAAYRAAKCGADVTIVESGSVFGGTSTLGGVNCWEPGIASFGLNRILYERMRTIPYAASVGKTEHPYDAESHIGLNGVDFSLAYEASLRRGDLGARQIARVHFEPEILARVMAEVLLEAGVRPVLNTAFLETVTESDRITGAKVLDLVSGERYTIPCDVLIDCTADAVVFRSLGLKTYFGEDAQFEFSEPSAPESATGIVNGVSLCFRVEKGGVGNEAPAWTHGTEAEDWASTGRLPASSVDAYPRGGYNFNPLPLMDGAEYFRLNSADRMKTLTARVYLYWEWMKRVHGHDGWHIAQIFPRVGVRESWRCRTLRMTTENDLRQGCFSMSDDIILLGDHILDTHGRSSAGKALSNCVHEPYGVYAASLICAEYENLLVSGRCAGLSHLAASSCRLSRTMMDMGEAAGAMASQGGDMRNADIAAARRALKFEEYLEWVGRDYFRIG